MKLIAFTLTFFTMCISLASDSGLVCSLSSLKNKMESDLTTIQFDNLQKFYSSKTGVDVGDRNYSYSLEVSKNENSFILYVVFFENIVVQDEVATAEFVVESKNLANNMLVIQEPLTDDNGKKILDFSCTYYQK